MLLFNESSPTGILYFLSPREMVSQHHCEGLVARNDKMGLRPSLQGEKDYSDGRCLIRTQPHFREAVEAY